MNPRDSLRLKQIELAEPELLKELGLSFEYQMWYPSPKTPRYGVRLTRKGHWEGTLYGRPGESIPRIWARIIAWELYGLEYHKKVRSAV